MPKVLFDYQNTVFEWSKPIDNPAFYLMQRLGKTIIFLRWSQYKKCRKVLIVCPLSVMNSWKKEITEENLNGIYVRSTDKTKPIWEIYRSAMEHLPNFYCVTNYECLLNSDLLKWDWDCICLDESTRIRKPDNKTTEVILDNSKHARHRVVLSGKPAPESLLDYFNQIKFLNGSFLGIDTYEQFKYKYFPMFSKTSPPSKHTKAAIAAGLERVAFTLRREDVNIGSHTFLQTRECEMSSDFRKIYDDIELKAYASLVDGDGKEVTISARWVVVAQNYLHQLVGGCPKFLPGIVSDHKIREIHNLIEGELKDEKVIIWCRFRKEVERVTQSLRDAGHNALMIYGSTSLADRGTFIDAFQTKPQYKYIVCQIKTAQMGLDLSAASTAIYYSNTWENENRAQSQDRFIHPSKTSPCLAIDLIVPNSIDEDIRNALDAKNESTAIFQGNIYKNFLSRLVAQNYASISDL